MLWNRVGLVGSGALATSSYRRWREVNPSTQRLDGATGRIIAWVLLIAMGLINVAGYAFDLYQRFWWFDRVLHACTILAMTLWLAIFVFNTTLNSKLDGSLLYICLVASVGVALGALWEVAEWGFDLVMAGDLIKGKHDTMLDVVMDTIGAILAGILALRLRPSQDRA